jgi:Resolvase, N terminal domain
MPPNLLAHYFIYGNPQWYGKPLKQRGPLPRSGGHSSRYWCQQDSVFARIESGGNLESQRRQYELVDVARQRGFHDIEVIDDDLGRSASGMMARPGFERLVAWLCAGEVGAVLCFDASRLARNGRDWHHLLELCGLVEARVIDLDGVYDPCQPNDRLAIAGTRSARSRWTLTSASAALSGCCSTNSRSSAAPGKFCFGHRSSAAATDQPAQ